MKQQCKQLIAAAVVGICLAISFAIGMGVYFGVYNPGNLLNLSLLNCTGTIVSIRDIEVRCGPGACWQHFAIFEWQPDANYVNDTSLQQAEVLLWQDANDAQSIYIPGSKWTVYYNVCPLTPLLDANKAICRMSDNMTRLLLQPVDTYMAGIVSAVSLATVIGCVLAMFVFMCVTVSFTKSSQSAAAQRISSLSSSATLSSVV